MQQTHDDIAFLTVGPSIVVRTHPAASVLKRVFDIVVSAVALAVLLPVAMVVALGVFVTSPGRVTFRQRRVGLYGNNFRIIKFRTMVRDAETRLQTDPELHAIYVANNYKVPAALDTRVTKLGRFLRTTSLDEIPQFWNVLVGHMSLVGPRPVVPGEIQRYGRFSPVYESVRPGLTGPWQCGGRSEVSYDERVRLDVEYVQNWTLWTDIVILLKTIPAVLRRHGAH